MRQKIFDGKSWHNPLKHKIFRYPKLWHTKDSPTKFFGTVRQKIFDGKSWYSPFLSINFFATGNFLKHSTEGFPYEISRHCETKNFRRKILILPLLIHKLFRYRKISETQHRRVPLRNFSALWDKKISTETFDTPPSLLSINFFATGNFLKHITKGFPYEIFRHCETKQFRRKNVNPPSLIPNIFRHQKYSETQKGSSTKFFGTVRQKFFNGKSWYLFA